MTKACVGYLGLYKHILNVWRRENTKLKLNDIVSSLFVLIMF